MRVRVVVPVAGAVLCLGILGLAPLAGTATADDGATRQYSLSSEAHALQATVRSESIPFGIPLSGSSHGASAAIDSNGGSTADAGAPYSPLISSLPKTGNGAAQGTFGVSLPVVPTMPGYVAADHPLTPTAAVTAGVYSLLATADATQARGRVGIGVQDAVSPRNNLFAEAHSALREQGDVIAEAAAGVSALRVDGVFEIADVSSRLSLLAGAEARPVLEGGTTFGTVTLAGLTSGIRDTNAGLLGTQVPLDTSTLPAINEALRPAGISVHLTPRSFTYADGSTSTGPEPVTSKRLTAVRSSAVVVTITRDVEGQGTQTLTMTMGQVSVAASNVLHPGVGAVGAPPTVTGTEPSAATGPALLPAGGLDASHAIPGAVVPGAVPALPTVELAPTGVGGLRDSIPTAAIDFLMGGRTAGAGLYLMLVLGAVVGLLGTMAGRLGGVRSR